MQTKVVEYGTIHSVIVHISKPEAIICLAPAINEGFVLAGHGLNPLPAVGDKGNIVFEKNSGPAKGHWQFYPIVKLEYFNGDEWVPVGEFNNEHIAWVSLGGDDFNYRTTAGGKVLTDKSKREENE